MDPNDTYVSPLATRNASPAMLELLSPRFRIRLWRKLWISLATHEKALGIDRISNDAIAAMEATVDNIDFASAANWEKRLRHDVMAHIHAYEEAAPAAKGLIHLGATSQFVVCNAELVIYRSTLTLIAQRLASVIDALGNFAVEHRALPTLGFTHYQAAQPTTVGKRATLWAQELALALEGIEQRIASLRFRGVKGTTGTQASFMTLFDGDGAKIDELDRRVTADFGFDRTYTVTGQTYPRIVDAQIAADLAIAAAAVHKMCNDIRLLAGMKQIEEPFEKEQVGSSAMAYKRNPMRCERATGLSRFVMSLASSPLMTAAEQWFERTLDDSSNKRLSLPEGFLALDGALLIATNVCRGLVVYPNVIAAQLNSELPFMATEEILMAAVRAGGDRQHLHEKIRQHSLAAAEQVKMHGKSNDLIERLKGDADFKNVDLSDVLDAKKYIGRAPEQVDRFVTEVVDPVRTRYESSINAAVELKV